MQIRRKVVLVFVISVLALALASLFVLWRTGKIKIGADVATAANAFTGTVVDASNDAPVIGAKIVLTQTSSQNLPFNINQKIPSKTRTRAPFYEATSGADGKFEIKAPKGEYRLSVIKSGYKDVPADDSSKITIEQNQATGGSHRGINHFHRLLSVRATGESLPVNRTGPGGGYHETKSNSHHQTAGEKMRQIHFLDDLSVMKNDIDSGWENDMIEIS